MTQGAASPCPTLLIVLFARSANRRGLMASLAIAAQMKQEHDQRLDIQAELQHTFEAIPIGLFTLDMQGRFMSANPALLEMLGPDDDIARFEYLKKSARNFGSILIGIETRDKAHFAAFTARMDEAGLAWRDITHDDALAEFLI